MSALISLLLPTRGRPQLAERFLRSAAEHADDPNGVEVVIYADDDDSASHALDAAQLACTTIVGPRISMGACNTACLRRSSGDIVVLTNDDVVIRTQGWDRRLRDLHASVSDGIYLAYPNDLFKGRRVCTFPILSRRTCDLIGDPFPESYRGAFIDYHLLDIFKRLERAGERRLMYLEGVVFEHMHHRKGKAPFDATYRARGRFEDDATFLALRDVRVGVAGRLMRVIRRSSIDVSDASKQSYSDAGSRLGPSSIADLTRCTINDCGLPAVWRLHLWFWFMARRIAARFL